MGNDEDIVAKIYDMECQCYEGKTMRVDHQDVYSCIVAKPFITPENVVASMFNYHPRWMVFLFRLRNVLVKPFGLEGGNMHTKSPVDSARILERGDCVSFFEVYERSEKTVSMGGDDSHLNCLVQVVISHLDSNTSLVSLRTVVQFNNLLGRLYFMVIGPFHVLVVKKFLAQTKK